MKRLIQYFTLCICLCMTSCYDDSALWESVRDHEARIAKLETLCDQLNTNISALQTIVESLGEGDSVSEVIPITENGMEIGYTIKFSSGKYVSIYHGKDGQNGQDGYAPVIGVAVGEDGVYYWTLDDEWILDEDGNKIQASGSHGNTPQLKIENDYWYVSSDNGKTWTKLDKATGESTNLLDVTYDDAFVYLTLSDGSVIELPKIQGDDLRVHDITEVTAKFSGCFDVPEGSKAGIILSEESSLPFNESELFEFESSSDGCFVIEVDNLKSYTQYYFTTYTLTDGAYSLGVMKSFVTKMVEVAVTTEVTGIGTRDANILVNWEMSAFDPSVSMGIKYRDLEDPDERWYSVWMEETALSGSYEFTLKDLHINATYEYAFFYEVNDVEITGDIEVFNLLTVSDELVGFHVNADKYVIKADGVDEARISVILDGVDKTDEAIFFNSDTGTDIQLFDGNFKTAEPGIYNIMVCCGTECSTISIMAIDYDVPVNAVDPDPENLSFVHRAFLTRYTGTNCGYCPFMMKIIRSLEDDNTIPDKAILAVVHSYNSNDPAYISSPKVNSYPYLVVNNTTGFFHSQGADALNYLIDEALIEDAPAGISVNSVLYDNSVLVVRAAVKAAQKGVYCTGIWLMEDGIYAIQQDYNGIADESYNIHDNCVRYVDDICLDKAHSMGLFAKGETKESVFVINLEPSWNIENLHFAVTVSELDDSGRDYTVCNAIDCTINEAVPFEYK